MFAKIGAREIMPGENQSIEAGTVGAVIELSFDDFWKDYSISAVFSNDERRTVIVPEITQNEPVSVTIPWEVLKQAGTVALQVVGTAQGKRVATRWCKVMEVVGYASELPDESQTPTATEIEQLTELVETVRSEVAASEERVYSKEAADALLEGKQNVLTFDGVPSRNSSNAISSGAVYNALSVFQPESFAEIQNAVRSGLADRYFSVGDQICVYKAKSVTAAVSGSGISSASVELGSFVSKVNSADPKSYVICREGGCWKLLGNAIALVDYGISTVGTAAEGDTITVEVVSEQLVFDIAATDGYDHPVENGLSHALSLVLHGCYENAMFDAAELLFVVTEEDYPQGLPAGTYNITLDHGAYNNLTEQDGTYEFTTTQVVPVGGGIRHNSIGKPQSVYSHSQITGGVFTTYDADHAMIEQNILTTEPAVPSGTSLGTTSSREISLRTNDKLNFTPRGYGGSNLYSESAIRQWLNSAAASGWWSGQNAFDMPTTSPTAGFLYGMDPNFVSVIGAVKKRTAKPVTEGASFEDTDEIVFLPSAFEIFESDENGVKESAVKDETSETTAYPLFDGMTNSDRIKYLRGSAQRWWLRSASCGNSGIGHYVNLSGIMSGGIMISVVGAVPACCIV